MKDSTFIYKAGACVIGSLLWDKFRGRANWHKESFGGNVFNKSSSVSIPIRYGRFSGKRKVPTMVFSCKYYQKKITGKGYVIPFRRDEEMTVERVTEQAKAMSNEKEIMTRILSKDHQNGVSLHVG